MEDEVTKQTLITEEQKISIVQQQADPPKNRKKSIIIGSIIFAVLVIVMIIILTTSSGGVIPPDGLPKSIRFALPSNLTLEIGDKRVAEVLFYSGKDDRTSDDYQTVTKRATTFTTDPTGVISIDPYGRIETLSIGKTLLKVSSAENTSISDSVLIEVKEKSGITIGTNKRIINYQGTKTKPSNLQQKLVVSVSKQEALSDPDVPVSLKMLLSNHPDALVSTTVVQGDIEWTIEKYSDKSNRTYVLRTNKTAPDTDRNKYQYFMGPRYLPGTGTSASSIEDDGKNGIWVTDSNNQITHIVITALNTTSKAFKMVRDYEPYLRHGLASGTDKRGDTWVAGVSDNDGLWTSMFAVGELMRYSTVKYWGYSDQSIAESRTSALRSLKAVLMVSNVASRNTTVDARLRHFNNTRTGDGTRLSQTFLKNGSVFAVDNFNGNSMAGVGFFGNDAGTQFNGLSYGGKKRYSYLPLNDSDWGNDTSSETPATSKRSIKGFIARSFGIKGVDTIPNGGLFFQHNADGTQKVVQDAYRLYDYSKNETPTLDLGNIPLPDVLMSVLKVGDVQYNKSDLFYKGDTSTDEVIGHLFIYKVAFDVLDDNDPEERTLKQLIVKTMIEFCEGMIQNGYSFVDATGQGTTWGKMVRDFMNSDSTIEDAPIKTLEILLSFKLCAYVTGDSKWEQQYKYLVEDEAYRYLDVVAGVWERWLWRNYNQDYNADPLQAKLNSSEQYSEQEIIRHVMMEIHYSDQEEAMLAYYLAFQLEQNEEYLQKYRQGLEGWWHSISRSQNPIWYFIYQLAYPTTNIQDHFGNDILEVAMWQLERHPVSTVTHAAYLEGSRPDVVCEGVDPVISVDPRKVLQKRKHISDSVYAERPLNKKTVADYDPLNLYEIRVLPKDERNINKFNAATFQHPFYGSSSTMEPSTTYTLPYWLGIYHKMIDPS